MIDALLRIKRIFEPMQLPVDSPKHQGQRKQLVGLLKEKGITNAAVIAALEYVPRHWFMDAGLVSHAYKTKLSHLRLTKPSHIPTRGFSVRTHRRAPRR